MMSGRPTDSAPFTHVARLLSDAIDRRVTPAAVIEVGRATAPIWQHAEGTLTYDAASAACALDTIFDLASLTKVIATTSLAMRIAEQQPDFIEKKISMLNLQWRGADRADVTVRHLLEHASGLPAHVKLYETLTGRDAFPEAIVTTPLAYAPGTESRYSDLGFMLLGLLIEDHFGVCLDASFSEIAARLDGPMQFTPPVDWFPRIAPTEIDPISGAAICGRVHDENAAALGGVAGHAGLFGTARSVGSFGQVVLQSVAGNTWLSRQRTMHEFVRRSTVPGSSRALGWDTMLPTSSCGTRMSARAIGHTGFTGTSLWIDPERDVYVVLLTNRVHPSREGEGIQQLRRDVHDAVMDGLSD